MNNSPQLEPSECLDCGWRGTIFRPNGLEDDIELTECWNCHKMRLVPVELWPI